MVGNPRAYSAPLEKNKTKNKNEKNETVRRPLEKTIHRARGGRFTGLAVVGTVAVAATATGKNTLLPFGRHDRVSFVQLPHRGKQPGAPSAEYGRAWSQNAW